MGAVCVFILFIQSEPEDDQIFYVILGNDKIIQVQ